MRLSNVSARMRAPKQSLLDRIFRLGPSHNLLRSVLQLGLFLVFYAGFYWLSSYVLDIAVFLWTIEDASVVARVYSDQILWMQTASLGLSLLVSYATFVSRDTWFEFAPKFHRLQAGWGWARWVSVFNDAVLKGFLVASGFVLFGSVVGWVDFEVSYFLDGRSLAFIIPSLLGQVLGFSIWLLILEFFRRFLHRVLVRQTEHKTIGALIAVSFEAYFIFITFYKFSNAMVESGLLILASLSWSLIQMIAYQHGARATQVEFLRASIARYAVTIGFWNSLIFIYGAPLLPFKSMGFVSLLTGAHVRSLGLGHLSVDKGIFLLVCQLLFVVLLLIPCVGSIRGAFSRKVKVPKTTAHQEPVGDLEFCESPV